MLHNFTLTIKTAKRTWTQLSVKHIRLFYDSRTRYDTIFAPSTAIQSVKGSPLSVIRLSGSKTEHVVQQLTRRTLMRIEPPLSDVRKESAKIIKPRYATLSKILNPDTSELVDEGLILWFPAPNSYTGEDVCELHLHGSQAIMSNVLGILGNMRDLRPAEPGEFTRRSVLNNKISLIQAESLPDLLASQTDKQRKLALKGYDGSTRAKYEIWIETLVSVLAHLEASIDFGEDELIGEERVVTSCIARLAELSGEISRFIEISSRCRSIIQTGVRVVILGKPNSGKSTFMNLVCQKNKSIVSNLSGTTRDVIEHSLELSGHKVTITDTAGLKNLEPLTADLALENGLLEQHESIEREGIKRAIDVANNADVILYMIDTSAGENKCDTLNYALKEIRELSSLIDGNKGLKLLYLVMNKIDLNEKLRLDSVIESAVMSSLADVFKSMEFTIMTTRLSCETRENFDQFMSHLTSGLDLLTQMPHADDATIGKDSIPNLDYVNERHLSLLKSTHRHLEQASTLTLDTIDEMAQHVRESVDYLSRVVGSVTNEQVIDIIFRDFCIGK